MAESSNKAKRQVKNPDTFRERAIKAGEEAALPSRPGLPKQLLGPIFRPLGKTLALVARWRPLRLVGKILIPAYFRNSWQELRLVTWPSWKQSRQLTFAVLVFAIVFGALIAIVDFGLDKLFKNLLLK